MKVTFEIDPGFIEQHQLTQKELQDALTNTQVDWTSKNVHYHRAHEVRKHIRLLLANAEITVEEQPELDMSAFQSYRILDVEDLKKICYLFSMFEESHGSLNWTHDALVDFMERKIYIRPKDAPRYLRELKKRAAEKRV